MKKQDIKKFIEEIGIVLSDKECEELEDFINKNICELKDLERYLFKKEQDDSDQKESIDFLYSLVGDKNVKRDS